MFGKGRGKPFVNEQVSLVRRARTEDDAKSIIRKIICENFFPQLVDSCGGDAAEPEPPDVDPNAPSAHRHLAKVVEWVYASLMRKSPWSTWTNDIYDAMRCIDHLPIS